ncbi:hypothetical protein SD77_2728 [Bacillus badius]|uniref:Uncharacterized protein n=1 Tax=Bacillus badius TaxID=1455 RepID=A0ABR5APZ1_BACBA|nr:hypothetical protein SD78_4401 [Bacillus badius]KIL75888.1 hypothetical protein SD77_2728 [Bacillus badius]KZR58580.1 hypothetical protein A3781_16045 [Bacillus badius]
MGIFLNRMNKLKRRERPLFILAVGLAMPVVEKEGDLVFEHIIVDFFSHAPYYVLCSFLFRESKF